MRATKKPKTMAAVMPELVRPKMPLNTPHFHHAVVTQLKGYGMGDTGYRFPLLEGSGTKKRPCPHEQHPFELSQPKQLHDVPAKYDCAASTA